MKYDPHNYQKQYARRKAQLRDGVPGVTPESLQIINRFLDDWEQGLNVGAGCRKGGRSPARLLALLSRMMFFARQSEKRFSVSQITDLTEEQIHSLFAAMRNGTLTREDGRPYLSTSDFVKDFKTFWNWHMKLERKRGSTIPDICVDLDRSKQKPQWVYLRDEDVKRLCEHAKYEYRVLMMFMFDAGLRSPTELTNVRVADLSDDCAKLHIREETSKTFGRRINLLLCPSLLRDFIREKNLKPADRVFPIHPATTNRYLKRLARRVLGDDVSMAGEKFSNLTMYDFRHSSACYWLPRYKHESSLKYRFGWKKTEQIHYYTEFLGMKDTIQQEDLNLVEEKTELEQQLAQSRRENAVMQDKLDALQKQLARVTERVATLVRRIPSEAPNTETRELMTQQTQC